MHSIRTALLAALAIATATPAMAVYKCKDHLGRTVYQEKACDTKATSEKVDTTPAASGITMESSYGKIYVGMDREEVQRAWGKPDDINRTVSKYGNREQWIYERGNYRRQYVYFEDGLVTSISSN